MDERKFIERLIEAIERKVDRGPVEEWTNHYFFLLSCDIEDKTGQRISESTLKRILGKKKTSKRFYNPQVQTKNILAAFLDYPNWHAFKNDPSGKETSEVSYTLKKETGKTGNNKKLFWTILLPLIAVVVVVLLENREPRFIFEAESIESEVPYTAIFNYDISKVRDSVFIDFGNYEMYHLEPSRAMITQYYRSASAPVVKVYTRDQLLSKTKLHNRSNGWQAGSSPNDTLVAFRPFEPQPRFISDDTLFLNPEFIKVSSLVPGETKWIEYRKSADFGISLDSMQFSCYMKNNPEIGGKRCFDGEILLFGSNNDIRMRFMEPGCTRYALLQISEKKHNGRFENLEQFAVDLSSWVNIEIETAKNHAGIFLNGNLIFEESYNEPLGELWGIVLRFYGNGAAHSVRFSEN